MALNILGTQYFHPVYAMPTSPIWLKRSRVLFSITGILAGYAFGAIAILALVGQHTHAIGWMGAAALFVFLFAVLTDSFLLLYSVRLRRNGGPADNIRSAD